MYVHCHNCKWEQDDFYSEKGYNPAKFLMSLNVDLLSPNIDEIIMVNDGKKKLTRREYVAKYYEEYAKRIRTMKWITYEQFKADPKKVCPVCGSDDLDID